MGGLLWTFIGPNQLQLHARMACLPDMKRLAALFVRSEELGVLVGAGLDFLPG